MAGKIYGTGEVKAWSGSD